MCKDMIYLETDELILRDLCEGDFDAYFKLKTDDNVLYFHTDEYVDAVKEALNQE